MATLAQLLNRAKADKSNNSSNDTPGLRIYGDSYEPFNERKLVDDPALTGRTLLAAIVGEREQVSRTGETYTAKEVSVYLSDRNGNPSTARVYLRLRRDSPLQVGQAIAPESITVANMRQNDQVLRGTYFVAGKEIADSEVNADFLKYLEEHNA